MITLSQRKAQLNWRPSRPNPHRLQYYSVTTTQTKILPITAWFPAWDQGQEGSCTAHGNGALAKQVLYIKHPTLKDFMPSRQFLYYNERVIEGDPQEDNGAQVGDGMTAIEKWGICDEKLWPYSKPFAKKPSASAYKAALLHQGLEAATVPATVDAIKAAISAQHPVSGGFTVYSSFMTDVVASSGIMPLPTKKEQIEGGHCVAWDGFDDNFKAHGEHGFFYCRNSWGTNWGLKAFPGWFMMPYSAIKKLCSDFHVLVNIE